MKSVTVKTVIKSCEECPNVDIQRDYTEDSFETCYRWDCSAAKGKNILRYRDWNEKDKFIPDWCPLAKKGNKDAKKSKEESKTHPARQKALPGRKAKR